jgi:hypothetical protein
VEKLDYLLWDTAPSPEALAGLARSVTVSVAASDVQPTLLMGKGSDLVALVEVWLDSLDTRGSVEACFSGRYDGYLVTESVPQSPSGAGDLLTHLSWFPKPERLTDEEFYRGWHDGHTPTTWALHPNRVGYVRDAVARVLTPGSPPLRGIVSEYFAREDYEDPRRLFGSKEAVAAAMAELPSYGDVQEMSCRPLWKGKAL